MLNYGISLFVCLFVFFFGGGGHFTENSSWRKLSDRYGEQPSSQVNFFVLKDHESSGIEAGLRLGTKNNHRQAFE